MENRALQADVLFYALGAIGLGLTGLAFGDFGRQWQPVPDWVPMRTPLAYLSAIILVAAGGAALTLRWRVAGAIALAALFAVCALLLRTATIMKSPMFIGAWLGFAELVSLAIAGFMAASSLRGVVRSGQLQALSAGYGLCAIVFGLCHFAYADITASMVPEWLPERHFWAHLTGVGHLAAGLALVSGVLARLAARMLGLMMASFVLLVHLPDTIASPHSHAAWTLQFLSLVLAGGAWLVGGVLARQEAKESLPNLWSAIGAVMAPNRSG